MDRTGYEWNIKVNKIHWWFQARNLIIKTVIKHSFKDKTDLKILDMGCGSGCNLEMLSHFGSVDAIEPDEEIMKYAQEENPNCKIYHGALPDDNPLKNKKYDLIVSLDVIEHIEQDEKTMSELKNMLNDGGKIIITVPAFQFLYGPSDFQAHHFRRYNKTMLKNMLKNAGFRKFKLYYFNTFLFLPTAVVKLYEKMFKPNTAKLETGDIGSLNGFFFKVMGFERHTLKFNPIGISLLAVIENEGKNDV